MRKAFPVPAMAIGLLAAVTTMMCRLAWRADAAGGVLPYDLAFSMKRLLREDRPALSPDGRWLAFSVRTVPSRGAGGDPLVNYHYLPNGTPKRVVGARLYVTEVETGETRSMGPATGNAWRPSWSPNNRQVALFSDADGTPALWVHDITRGAARKVTHRRLNPSIFPGDEACWSLDGSELYVRLRPPGERERAQEMRSPEPRPGNGSTVMVYRAGAEAQGQKGDEPSSVGRVASSMKENAALAAIHVRTGTVRILVPAETVPLPGHLRLSASGKWISYLSVFRQTDPVHFAGRYDLAILPSSGGRVQVLAADLPFPGGYLETCRWHPTQDLLIYRKDGLLWLVDLRKGAIPESRQLAPELEHFLPEPLLFSRDGRYLIARTLDRQNGSGPPSIMLALIPLDGSKGRTIAVNGKGEFLGVLRGSQRTAWQPQPDFLKVAFDTSGELTIERINLQSGEKVTLRRDRARLQFIGSGGDHHAMVAEYQDASTPPDLYRFSDDCAQRQRLTRVEPRLDGITVGRMETYETAVPRYDGKMIPVRTAVLLPTGAKRGDRLPTVVCIYGGAMLSGRATEFGGGIPIGVPALLFASRGYAVILPDVPMGPGDTASNPMREMTDVLLPQIYHAGELGYTDLQHVGLIGHSYGGYSTAAILSQTNLFRAGVAVSGIYDLPGLYGRMGHSDTPDFFSGLLEKAPGRMGTHPWASLTRYLTNSPYYQADKIDTPVLLIHGEQDGAAPNDEAEKMYNALRRLGKTVQLATYEGEGHVPYEWSFANAADASKRIVEFLDRYVCGNARSSADAPAVVPVVRPRNRHDVAR